MTDVQQGLTDLFINYLKQYGFTVFVLVIVLLYVGRRESQNYSSIIEENKELKVENRRLREEKNGKFAQDHAAILEVAKENHELLKQLVDGNRR